MTTLHSTQDEVRMAKKLALSKTFAFHLRLPQDAVPPVTLLESVTMWLYSLCDVGPIMYVKGA